MEVFHSLDSEHHDSPDRNRPVASFVRLLIFFTYWGLYLNKIQYLKNVNDYLFPESAFFAAEGTGGSMAVSLKIHPLSWAEASQYLKDKENLSL